MRTEEWMTTDDVAHCEARGWWRGLASGLVVMFCAAVGAAVMYSAWPKSPEPPRVDPIVYHGPLYPLPATELKGVP